MEPELLDVWAVWWDGFSFGLGFVASFALIRVIRALRRPYNPAGSD